MKLGSSEVSFQHFRNAGITSCTVVAKGMIYQGTARCSKDDNFCRETGRKTSLTKALNKSNLSKIQRKNIWNSYRNMGQTPKW